MSEDDDSSRVKALRDNDQLTEQDDCTVITGTWVREEDGKWIFDTLIEDKINTITVNPLMEYEDLVIDGIPTNHRRPHYANVTDQTLLKNKDDEDSESDEGFEEDWLEFAISETPLTCPPIQNDVGGSFGVQPNQTIPYNRNGIVIRDPLIRLASPPHEASYRGKGKGIATEPDKWKAADKLLQPQMSTNKGVFGGNGESSRTVRRRLFEDPLAPPQGDIEMEEPCQAEPEPIAQPLLTTTLVAAQPSSLYTWTRFQDSLHDLLNDESSEPVLFGRDAPPVIESTDEIGKIFERLY
ncbi:SWIM-type domain-containing protein [Raphanus sativus]|nr:SWIM-type domain-containing protein [Raphanus sativus]